MSTMMQVSSMRRGTVALAATGLMALIGGVWILRTFDPSAAGSFFPSCLFLEFTGLYCPGCGITRALHALVHFDLGRAIAMNAVIVLSLPMLPLMALHGMSGGRVLPAPVRRVVFNGYFWIGLLLLFGVLRNLPAFAWLAPGGSL